MDTHHLIRKIVSTTVLASAIAVGTTLEAKAMSVIDIQPKIDACITAKEHAHEMAECARRLGLPEDHIVIKTAQSIWTEQHDLQNTYKKQLVYIQEKTDQRMAEYQQATIIYEKLRERGVPEVATCAIIGNVMREVGGDTLNVSPLIYGGNGGYYGMCQWSLYYNPSVAGASVDGQIDYLMRTIEGTMRAFGGSYEYFKNMSDVGAAAKYFNNYYERGAHNVQRAANGYMAYEYFNS